MTDEVLINGRKDQVIELLNKAWKTIEPPSYEEFNRILPATNIAQLIALESKDERLGLAGDDNSLSVLSLIATITDILVDDRLAAIVTLGKITGWCWYIPPKA